MSSYLQRVEMGATVGGFHSEENFVCSICLDVFTEPVVTPCGHNYCRTCIMRYWDNNGVCRCPLCSEDLRRIQKHEVDVTLDADTAHPRLVLSEDGKQVSLGNIWNDLPRNIERFSTCPSVLGKQGFSSGRFYYEVQVGGKTAWTIGVARGSINRKGDLYLLPNYGFWTIMLRNGDEYEASAYPPIVLPVREKVHTVGVFVDYEKRLVSFYDVGASLHLYSFTGCTFTKKLYPYLSTFFNRNGTNSAPLIISPGNHTD